METTLAGKYNEIKNKYDPLFENPLYNYARDDIENIKKRLDEIDLVVATL